MTPVNETHSGMPPERKSVMAALSARLLPILGDKQKADEYAFNCSDIYCEVLQFNWLIENILNKEAASEDDLAAIEGFIAVHWRCHANQLYNAMEGIEANDGEDN